MNWLFDLTPHQLDVLRTLASIAGGIGGFLSGVAVVYARLANKNAKQAAQQTASSQWVNGALRVTPVAELARHAALSGEGARQEVSDLAEWVKGTGKRRLPTSDVPRISTYIGEPDA